MSARAISLIRRVRVHVLVRGTVQGMGFRPFVYERATALRLTGWVANCAEGLVLEAEGRAQDVAHLLAEIRDAPPPNARIVGIETREVAVRDEAAFTIRPSLASGPRSVQILPDLATCAACLSELFDPRDRR